MMSVIVFLLELSPLCAIIYLYLSWNQWKTSRSPRCFYSKSLFNSLAIQYCSALLKNPYEPTIWAIFPAIHAAYWQRWSSIADRGKIEYLEVSNSGLVGIFWPLPIGKISQTDQSPIVIFLPSSINFDNTVQPFIDAAFENGFRPTVFLPQDCQCLPKLKEQSTDAQQNSCNKIEHHTDFGEAVEYIKSRYPKAKIYLVGLSFGNATLFKFITENIHRHEINGVVSVSPLWNTEKSTYLTHKSGSNDNNNIKHLNQMKISRSYDSFFGRFPRIKRVTFDPICSTNSSTFMSSNVLGKLKKVRTPMMVIYSKDDPKYSSNQINRVGAMWKNSDLLMVVETFTGGHVGFLQFAKPRSWAADLTFQYFDAVGKFKDSTVKDLSD